MPPKIERNFSYKLPSEGEDIFAAEERELGEVICCGNATIQTCMNYQYKVDDHPVVVPNVIVNVCSECGSVFFDPPEITT